MNDDNVTCGSSHPGSDQTTRPSRQNKLLRRLGQQQARDEREFQEYWLWKAEQAKSL
jgi:hypothetical protein